MRARFSQLYRRGGYPVAALDSMRSRGAAVSAGFLLTLLAACGGGGGAAPAAPNAPAVPPAACSDADIAGKVATAMETRYFWNDEIAQRDKYTGLDPSRYADADALLNYLRYRPDAFDRHFTHVTSIDDENLFFGAGQFVGFGFSFRYDAYTGEVVITQVFAGSPATAGGFERGQRILAINGRTILEIENGAGLDDALGPAEAGVTRSFELKPPTAPAFFTIVAKATVDLDPVPQHRVIDAGGQRIGYLEFRTFVDTAQNALQAAFADFHAAGVTDVIVDVRYNGGGLLSVADYFGSLLAGPSNVSRIMASVRFNSANAYRNTTTTFASVPNAIDLDSIVFITTADSASATELVINALAPYVDVATVGERTFGKPVGQDAVDICDQRLRIVTFDLVNADSEGEYYDGLPADCAAEDDLSRAVGDPNEALLAAALARVTTGACTTGRSTRQSAVMSVIPERQQPSSARQSPARTIAHAY